MISVLRFLSMNSTHDSTQSLVHFHPGNRKHGARRRGDCTHYAGRAGSGSRGSNSVGRWSRLHLLRGAETCASAGNTLCAMGGETTATRRTTRRTTTDSARHCSSVLQPHSARLRLPAPPALAPSQSLNVLPSSWCNLSRGSGCIVRKDVQRNVPCIMPHRFEN